MFVKCEKIVQIFDGERNERGERHGQGKAILPNDDIYDGNYRHGLRDGRGLYVFKKNGSRFDGEWREGMKHGQGISWYPDGTRYEGSLFSIFFKQQQQQQQHYLKNVF